MIDEVQRLMLERVRQAVTAVCIVAIIGFGIEIGLGQIAPDPDPVLRNRTGDFLLSTGSMDGPDRSQTAIDGALHRPLFIQGRGVGPPRVATAVAIPPSTPDVEIRLLGVELSGVARLAIIQLSDSDHLLRAVEGQPIGSWILARIFGDHIDLTRKSESRSIYLGDTKPPIDDEAADP